MTCTYAPCTAKFKRKDLAQHRRDECLGVPLPCLNAGCQSLLNRKVMVEHLSHCRFQDVKCPDCNQVRQPHTRPHTSHYKMIIFSWFVYRRL